MCAAGGCVSQRVGGLVGVEVGAGAADEVQKVVQDLGAGGWVGGQMVRVSVVLVCVCVCAFVRGERVCV